MAVGRQSIERNLELDMSGQLKTALTDLIVVIDTSGSMGDEAKRLSDVVDAAIQKAETSCSADLRHCWFGIEGTWPGTEFKQSYRDYLLALSPNLKNADFAGTYFVGNNEPAKEDGAGAVEDLAKFFDWREGASRTIFYLGDEGLKGGDPRNEADRVARDAAIEAARREKVMVFTYFGTPLSADSASLKVNVADYHQLAVATRGAAYTAPADHLGGFEPVLAAIICRKPLKPGEKQFDRENMPPGESWNPCNSVQLDLIVDYETRRPLEGVSSARIRCKNTGTVALSEITLRLALDDRLDSFEAVFVETGTDEHHVSVPDLEPGREAVIPYEVNLVRDDPSYQEAADRAYRLRIRPSFKAEFSFSQAAHYNVDTRAQETS